MPRRATFIGHGDTSHAPPGTGIPADGEFVEMPSTAEDAQETAFEDLINDSSADRAGLQIWVYFQPVDEHGEPAGRAKLEWLFTVPVDGATLDQIFNRVREKFMKPHDQRWLVRVQVRRGDGSVKWNRLYPVRNSSEAPAPPPAEKSQMAEVLAAMQRMMETQQAREDANRIRPVADGGMSIEKIIALQSSARNETMQLMAMLLQATRPAEAATGKNSLMEMIAGIKAIKDLSGEFSGETPSGAAGALETVKALAPPFMSFMDMMKNQRPGAPALPAPTFPPQNVTPTFPPQHNAPAMPAAEQQNMWFMIREQLGQLAQVAGTKPDVKLIAEQILRPLPESYDDAICAMLEAPNWFESMCAVQPALAPHKEWATALRDEMLASFTPEPDKPGAVTP